MASPLKFENDVTFVAPVILPSNTSIGNVSSTEIGYVDGVTSAIQTQIDTQKAVTNLYLASVYL